MPENKHDPQKKQHEKRFDSTRESIKIVRVAAFCFAIVSWIATADGLNLYVFENQPIHATLVSFGVQGILFVFNLKLPEYFKRIGTKPHTNTVQNTKNISSSKGYKCVLIALYVALLIFSSTFSFVFICNNAVYGRNTGYVDNNIELNTRYWEIRQATQNYINENVKATQILASEQLSDLQTMVGDLFTNNNGANKTFDEVTNELDEANTNLEAARLDESQKKSDYEIAAKEVDNLEGVKYWKKDEYAAAVKKRNNAYTAWQKAQQTTFDREQEQKQAQKVYDNWSKTESAIIGGFLAELLSFDPDERILKDKMNYLNAAIIELGNGGNIPDNFGEIVTKTQSLQITIDQYLALRSAGKSTVFDSANTTLNSALAITPNPQLDSFNQDKQAWQATWKTAFDDLKSLIQSLPDYSERVMNDKLGQSGRHLINTEILESYDPIALMHEIDSLVRGKTTDINTIEKVFKIFFSEYPAAAYISIVIAYFLDLASLAAGLFQYAISEADKERKRALPQKE